MVRLRLTLGILLAALLVGAVGWLFLRGHLRKREVARLSAVLEEELAAWRCRPRERPPLPGEPVPGDALGHYLDAVSALPRLAPATAARLTAWREAGAGAPPGVDLVAAARGAAAALDLLSRGTRTARAGPLAMISAPGGEPDPGALPDLAVLAGAVRARAGDTAGAVAVAIELGRAADDGFGPSLREASVDLLRVALEQGPSDPAAEARAASFLRTSLGPDPGLPARLEADSLTYQCLLRDRLTRSKATKGVRERLRALLGSHVRGTDRLELWRALRAVTEEIRRLGPEEIRPGLAALLREGRSDRDVADFWRSIFLKRARTTREMSLRWRREALIFALALRARKRTDGAWPADPAAARPAEVREHPSAGDWSVIRDPEGRLALVLTSIGTELTRVFLETESQLETPSGR
jgi:hypothetical protein